MHLKKSIEHGAALVKQLQNDHHHSISFYSCYDVSASILESSLQGKNRNIDINIAMWSAWIAIVEIFPALKRAFVRPMRISKFFSYSTNPVWVPLHRLDATLTEYEKEHVQDFDIWRARNSARKESPKEIKDLYVL